MLNASTFLDDTVHHLHMALRFPYKLPQRIAWITLQLEPAYRQPKRLQSSAVFPPDLISSGWNGEQRHTRALAGVHSTQTAEVTRDFINAGKCLVQTNREPIGIRFCQEHSTVLSPTQAFVLLKSERFIQYRTVFLLKSFPERSVIKVYL